jgi:hypothetical protein
MEQTLPERIIKNLSEHFQHNLKAERQVKDMTIEEVRKVYQYYKEKATQTLNNLAPSNAMRQSGQLKQNKTANEHKNQQQNQKKAAVRACEKKA